MQLEIIRCVAEILCAHFIHAKDGYLSHLFGSNSRDLGIDTGTQW